MSNKMELEGKISLGSWYIRNENEKYFAVVSKNGNSISGLWDTIEDAIKELKRLDKIKKKDDVVEYF